MRYSEPDLPRAEIISEEENLRRENAELRRQVQQLRGSPHASVGVPARLWRPSRLTIWAICLAAIVLLIIAFLAGYVPLQKRTTLIAAEAHGREQAIPRVDVIRVGRSPRDNGLQLPGNIQALTEAPILGRADGYIKQRMVDIGDRVHQGQQLAVIEAPELDEQVRQAEANLQQARAAVDQANANLRQGKADLELARVTAKRYADLVGDGSVSVQENDQYQAQYQARIASVEALEQALAVQRSAVVAAQANLARLESMKSYRVVIAPFDGVITQRNVDSGALVNNGNTLLFRIAQTANLRIYLNVPQSFSNSVHRGDTASVTVSNLPGRQFSGSVARTANSLDPASRTLLAEVHVPNPTGALLPGMYAQVELLTPRANPPLLVPSDALIVGSDGTRVALVGSDHRAHLRKVQPGRDYGDKLEILSGLREGDTIVANPSDAVEEGIMVDPVLLPEKGSNAHQTQ
jgi:RND family efflux transporter MFP subunit